jgi:hypothetical protein
MLMKNIRRTLSAAPILFCSCLPLPVFAQSSGASLASPAPLPSAPAVYTLDGVALGSPVRSYISIRGNPDTVGARVYVWRSARGGTLSVATDSDGTIVFIDVTAGAAEIRSVEVLGGVLRFDDGGHMNNAPPDWVPYGGGDACGPSLKGSPCWVYLLPRDDELIMNFGHDNGMADWDLSEVVLGSRVALLKSGLVTGAASPR